MKKYVILMTVAALIFSVCCFACSNSPSAAPNTDGNGTSDAGSDQSPESRPDIDPADKYYDIPADREELAPTDPACVENGWDSDSSPVKQVSVNDVEGKKVSFLKKDISSYVAVNSDVVGWIYVKGPESVRGLPISAPILQADDNEFYLDHDWKGNKNTSGGSIYAAFNCDMSSLSSNYNTVFYGHAKSMKVFGGLIYLDNAVRWYSDANNHFVLINTENERTVWQIFSWYMVKSTGNYRKISFESGDEFVKYANELQNRNEISALKEFDFKTTDRIITFSTCKRDMRVAVHAVLVRSESLE